jgi:hypothetical protein
MASFNDGAFAAVFGGARIDERSVFADEATNVSPESPGCKCWYGNPQGS